MTIRKKRITTEKKKCDPTVTRAPSLPSSRGVTELNAALPPRGFFYSTAYLSLAPAAARDLVNTPRAVDCSATLGEARPPPIANLVKGLETLGYRWAYRVVDLPGEAMSTVHTRGRRFFVNRQIAVSAPRIPRAPPTFACFLHSLAVASLRGRGTFRFLFFLSYDAGGHFYSRDEKNTTTAPVYE